MDPQLRHLRALVAVVEAGTFTDAATELGVSQAAVSRSIAALESALGVRVLQRTTRHVALTATGRQVLAGARRILDEVTHLHRLTERQRSELRVGYAWAALGKHTRRLQRAWAADHPGTALVFVHTNTPSAGLSDGTADVAVIRRALDDPRFDTALIGTEARCAAVATDNPLARRRTLHLRDLTRYPVAIDARTGTTTLDLWHPGPPPAAIRSTHGVDEWLTLIAANQAVGVTSEATANQNPRPGVAYRTLRHAPRIPVRLAWWRDDPPVRLGDLVRLSREAYQP
ncbi:LysR family transcriptional regulator [Actinoplanes utahensis]|uniref:LysR family transcriptional regulator n=1 Tax=Actinoplanes utahensis TaxID=1869 RepID=A0A0A6UNB3_ACTUT|nr:LysR family transcriptional regulator [Actinoplanes utahensis]KHD75779.1 LysR family transcriptional regulator [Actinoplanes utahensis]GIF34521.1 LysR family transcriptional regulator [Actinoplanes utahensis]